MALFSGSFTTVSLAEVLRMLVNTKQTGALEISQGNHQGVLLLEKGRIVHGQAGGYSGMAALFQFIIWRAGEFKFVEGALRPDNPQSLTAIEPQVLIEGVERKIDELAALQQAIPSFDSIVYYIGGEGLESVEATPSDLGLLILADGSRSVRQIADQVKQPLLEVARSLAKFRLAGVLELVVEKRSLA